MRKTSQCIRRKPMNSCPTRPSPYLSTFEPEVCGVEYEILRVVQALLLVYAEFSDTEHGGWGSLKAAYHDRDQGIIFLRYEFTPAVAHPSEDIPLVMPEQGGDTICMAFHSSILCTYPMDHNPTDTRAYASAIRELADSLALDVVFDYATSNLFFRMESGVPPEIMEVASDELVNLVPQCQKYNLLPLPPVYMICDNTSSRSSYPSIHAPNTTSTRPSYPSLHSQRAHGYAYQ